MTDLVPVGLLGLHEDAHHEVARLRVGRHAQPLHLRHDREGRSHLEAAGAEAGQEQGVAGGGVVAEAKDGAEVLKGGKGTVELVGVGAAEDDEVDGGRRHGQGRGGGGGATCRGGGL